MQQTEIESSFIKRMNFDQYIEFCEYLVNKIDQSID